MCVFLGDDIGLWRCRIESVLPSIFWPPRLFIFYPDNSIILNEKFRHVDYIEVVQHRFGFRLYIEHDSRKISDIHSISDIHHSIFDIHHCWKT